MQIFDYVSLAQLTRYRLLDSGAFSDLTITCGPDSYQVHKAIVCARADFFARAIKFGGKVRTSRYSLSGMISFWNMDADI